MYILPARVVLYSSRMRVVYQCADNLLLLTVLRLCVRHIHSRSAREEEREENRPSSSSLSRTVVNFVQGVLFSAGVITSLSGYLFIFSLGPVFVCSRANAGYRCVVFLRVCTRV